MPSFSKRPFSRPRCFPQHAHASGASQFHLGHRPPPTPWNPNRATASSHHVIRGLFASLGLQMTSSRTPDPLLDLAFACIPPLRFAPTSAFTPFASLLRRGLDGLLFLGQRLLKTAFALSQLMATPSRSTSASRSTASGSAKGGPDCSSNSFSPPWLPCCSLRCCRPSGSGWPSSPMDFPLMVWGLWSA